MEEELEEGRLSEDPFSSSDDGTVVWPAEDGEERDDLPPRKESVESTQVFRDERLPALLTGERLAPPGGERGGNKLREQV